MLFGYFTLFVALVISAVAEFYSVVGLTAIFSAAFWPVVIMGAVLGVGKLTAAVWLKLNWERAPWTYKLYLVPAVVFLMFLTSMGIFGFLSKAHSDQSLISGDVLAKLEIYDQKIKTSKENIQSLRNELKQMDAAVDQVMARSSDEKGADKSNTIRKSQQRDRTRIAKEIETNQKLIGSLNDEAAPIRAEVRKVEAEVGPIKYIAALIYGDNPDANILERAVRWVIILIVAVFDPLALMLNLAGLQSIRWYNEKKEEEASIEDVKEWFREGKERARELDKEAALYEADDGPIDPTVLEQLQKQAANELPTGETITKTELFPEKSLLEQHPYLTSGFKHFENLVPMVSRTYSATAVTEEDHVVTDTERPGDYLTLPTEEPTTTYSKFPKVPETENRIKAVPAPIPEAVHVPNSKHLVPDNAVQEEPANGFGIQYPLTANKGDMFLRVDYLPNRLFKYNGNKWIEVDKTKTDSYTYNEQYIHYLIEKLATGEYDLDQLSAMEQELVAEKLQQQNDKT